MIDFIDDHRDVYGVEPICKVLPIAPSTYHEAKIRETAPHRRSARQQRDARVCEAIQQTWDANHCVYGARKVWRQLQRDQCRVARCTVERLMRDMGLCGVTRGRASRTTRSVPRQTVHPRIMSAGTSPRMRRTSSGLRILRT